MLGSTIAELLAEGDKADTAIAAPGVPPLSYADLRHQVERTLLSLGRSGVGRGDRVALVLPGGAELATAFLGVAAGASAAPLNPAYRAEEFEFYLSDLAARALIVERGSQSPARDVAARLGILVLELEPQPESGAGTFSLSPSSGSLSSGRGGVLEYAHPEDGALLLHTSGTTSRPKLVPLSQRNITASARASPRRSGLPPRTAA